MSINKFYGLKHVIWKVEIKKKNYKKKRHNVFLKGTKNE